MPRARAASTRGRDAARIESLGSTATTDVTASGRWSRSWPGPESDDQQPSMRPGQHLRAGGTEFRVLAEVGDDLVEAREERMVVGSHARQYAHRASTPAPRRRHGSRATPTRSFPPCPGATFGATLADALEAGIESVPA